MGSEILVFAPLLLSNRDSFIAFNNRRPPTTGYFSHFFNIIKLSQQLLVIQII